VEPGVFHGKGEVLENQLFRSGVAVFKI